MEIETTHFEENTFLHEDITQIQQTIESMNKFNQIEILRILKKYPEVTLNENKYGIHINLTELKYEILNELFTYIKYVNTQEIAFNSIEKQKEYYKNTYFSKAIKDHNKK